MIDSREHVSSQLSEVRLKLLMKNTVAPHEPISSSFIRDCSCECHRDTLATSINLSENCQLTARHGLPSGNCRRRISPTRPVCVWQIASPCAVAVTVHRLVKRAHHPYTQPPREASTQTLASHEEGRDNETFSRTAPDLFDKNTELTKTQ